MKTKSKVSEVFISLKYHKPYKGTLFNQPDFKFQKGVPDLVTKLFHTISVTGISVEQIEYLNLKQFSLLFEYDLKKSVEISFKKIIDKKINSVAWIPSNKKLSTFKVEFPKSKTKITVHLGKENIADFKDREFTLIVDLS